MQREHEHGCGRSDSGYMPGCLKPVHDGHLQVQDHDVGMQLLDSFNGNLAIFRLTAHPSVRILLDVEPNHAADGSAVIDNENGVPGVRIRGMRERLR